MRHVVIFRRDLFKVSEPFIQDQAAAHRWRVTFIGDHVAGAPPTEVAFFLASARDALQKHLASQPPDIVHAHFGVDISGALPLARRYGVPLVVTLHGFDVTRHRRSCVMSGRPNLVRYGMFRPSILGSVDHCFAVSEFIRSAAIEAGAPTERMMVHHIGTPLTNLPKKEPSPAAAPPPLRIAHVARLVEKKGTRILLEAVALAEARGVTCEVVVVGDGPLRAALSKLATRLGLSDRVEFRGAQPHSRTLEIIAAAHVLCLPSIVARNGDAEGLGMVLLEAAAIGTPIVASSSGGITDFVSSGRTGILVPPSDVRALSDALVLARQEPELMTSLACRARERVAADFEVRRQTRCLEEHFERIIAERGTK
jgi:glycosyltransferase involved in cell wall biosynthesis